MKTSFWMSGLLAIAIAGGSNAKAQAPAGATGQCKDGTYSTAASKSGACSGHKGVQTWYSQAPAAGSKAAQAAPAPTQKSPAIPAAQAAPSPAQTPVTPAPARAQAAPATTAPAATTGTTAPRTSTANMAQAPGGGPGMVWVNTKSKVYHCQGTAFYGKTKAGKYVTEDAAKAEGDRADNNKPCTK